MANRLLVGLKPPPGLGPKGNPGAAEESLAPTVPKGTALDVHSSDQRSRSRPRHIAQFLSDVKQLAAAHQAEGERIAVQAGSSQCLPDSYEGTASRGAVSSLLEQRTIYLSYD